MEQILHLMAGGPLRLFRIGSSIVPFASHGSLDFDWEPFAESRLLALGRSFVPLGFRFSMHPGQYAVLNSPSPGVVEAAIAEIGYSCRVLDLMGLDHQHKVVVHGGGVYGDRPTSIERLTSKLIGLPAFIRNRLVLENDERIFNLAEIVEVSEKSGIPAVFDIHHHQINPSEPVTELLSRLRAVWSCVPKVHISSQRPNSRIGAHDDMVFDEDLETLCKLLPFEADLMIEAKAKEVAAIRAYDYLERTDKIALSVKR